MSEITVKTMNGKSRVRYRPTWAEIDLNAIAYNSNQICRVVGKDTKIMAVVKANAVWAEGIDFPNSSI